MVQWHDQTCVAKIKEQSPIRFNLIEEIRSPQTPGTRLPRNGPG